MRLKLKLLTSTALMLCCSALAQVPRATDTQTLATKLVLPAKADPGTPTAQEFWLSTTTAGTLKYRTIAGATLTLATTADLAAYQPLDADLTSIAGNSTGGFLTRTASNTYTARTITGTAGQVTVTNGDGVSGAPTISLPSTITQATTFSSTTDSTSTTSGSVIISGGLGVAKNVWFGAQLTQTYAPGVFAAGTVRSFLQTGSGSGDAGGTTNVRAFENQMLVSGSNNLSAATAVVGSLLISGSAGTVSTANSIWGYGSVSSGMGVTIYNGLLLSGVVSGAGNIGTWNAIAVNPWTFSSSGDITGVINGLVFSDIGRAGATVVSGINILNLTKGSGNAYGIRSQMTAASGKWTGYFDGTADFYVAGKVGLGIAATATSQLTLAASTTSVSSLNIPHGSAPSSPVNGDIWTTTAGVFARINGATVGPL